MDGSQSSDAFSGSGNYLFGNPVEIMDTGTYEDLVNYTKISLSKNFIVEVHKPTFTELFSSVLDNCYTCVTQSLNLVIGLVSDPEATFQISEYLDNAVNILRLLCGFFTKIIEETSMNSSNMKSFPTTTGRLIISVFIHCKDSESLYDTHLKSVEKQLKDLFRNCHELQLTYLMVLEKHFIFDLTEYEDLCIFVEALDINLKIGEIVQALDVKTMAEQWKAYTMICEKYSSYLIDRHIYEDCTKALCKMIENNLRTAIEIEEEDKVIIRSLKVTSFTIKILLKMCNIFKHAPNKNYEQIMEMLLYIYLQNNAYLEYKGGKSSQFLNLVNNNVANPAEILLKELLFDEQFVNYFCKYQKESFRKDDYPLSYIFLVISAIKSVIRESNIRSVKHMIIDCIFKLLPDCHIWFNTGLKFKSSNASLTFGLYEHLLANTFAMASTFDSEEINYLEQKMYESLLGTDCYSALFSSNLWELLARSNPKPKQFLLGQVMCLCKVYQKLENNKMFSSSPQKVHLSHTLNKLFKNLNTEDKIRIHNQFKVSDGKNMGLWSVLEIKNLTVDFQKHIADKIIEQLKMKLHKLFAVGIENLEDIESLIHVMKLGATSSLVQEDEVLENYVLKGWMTLCPRNNKLSFARGALDRSSLWYIEYIGALASLTTTLPFFVKSATVKILHVVSNLIERGNRELKLALMKLLFNILQHLYSDTNKHAAETLLLKSFKMLFQDSDNTVKNKLWNELGRRRDDTDVVRMLSKILATEEILQEKWRKFTNEKTNYAISKEHLLLSTNLRFSHKCIENQTVTDLSDAVSLADRTNSNNFDFADIDTLFEVESDSEPACKKAKLDTRKAEEIISRLEKDVELLRNVKENIATGDCKVRVRILCQKLVNIID